jgi:hypothetical protein
MIKVIDFEVTGVVVAPAPEITFKNVQLIEMTSSGAIIVSSDPILAKARVIRLSIRIPGQPKLVSAVASLKPQSSDKMALHIQAIYRVQFTYLNTATRKLFQSLEREPIACTLLHPLPSKALNEVYVIRYGSQAVIIETQDPEIKRAKVIAMQFTTPKAIAKKQGSVALNGSAKLLEEKGADGCFRAKIILDTNNKIELPRYLEMVKIKTKQSNRVMPRSSLITRVTPKLKEKLKPYAILIASLLFLALLLPFFMKEKTDPYAVIRGYHKILGQNIAAQVIEKVKTRTANAGRKINIIVVCFDEDDFEVRSIKKGLNEKFRENGKLNYELINLKYLDLERESGDKGFYKKDIDAILTRKPNTDAIISLLGFPKTVERITNKMGNPVLFYAYEYKPSVGSLKWIKEGAANCLISPRKSNDNVAQVPPELNEDESYKEFFLEIKKNGDTEDYEALIEERKDE